MIVLNFLNKIDDMNLVIKRAFIAFILCAGAPANEIKTENQVDKAALVDNIPSDPLMRTFLIDEERFLRHLPITDDKLSSDNSVEHLIRVASLFEKNRASELEGLFVNIGNTKMLTVYEYLIENDKLLPGLENVVKSFSSEQLNRLMNVLERFYQNDLSNCRFFQYV